MVLLDLTTGQVAGILAAGIFAINILFKLLWPVILVGMMNMQASAATWSLMGAQIHSSYWPTILRTDSTATGGVRMGLRLTAKMSTLTALLLAIASIITPLGLYESIAPGKGAEMTQFQYAPDKSVFGIGTLPRPQEGFSRICGYLVPVACPYSGDTINTVFNETGAYSDAETQSSKIPRDYMMHFQSGLSKFGQSVSSVFDISWRTYSYSTDVNNNLTNLGSKYAVGAYSQFNQLFLEEDYQLVEGLIVDMKNGSIGFRNHTIPSASKYGAAWTEDILFIEPVTECANTNLTFEWEIPLNNSALPSQVANLALVDHGGFKDLNTEFPEFDWWTAQDDPQIPYRAYRAAWYNNIYTALYYNITNPGPSRSGMKAFSYMESDIGSQYTMLGKNFTNFYDWFHRKLSAADFGTLIEGVPQTNFNGTLSSLSTGFETGVQENPWEISMGNFSDAQQACTAVFGSDRGNLSNIVGYCSTILGTPQQKGEPGIIMFEKGTSWQQPLYGCASFVRAVIKTVSFQFNGTGLEGLAVTKIEDKHYDSEEDMPTWAVESSDMRLRDGAPLWGIVDEDQKDKFVNVSYVRKPSLWLPGLIDSVNLGLSPANTGQNLPGVDFFTDALSTAYAIGMSNNDAMFDYSGANSVGTFNKWKNLSATPEGAAKIINLVWADVAANAVVGTRSQFPESGAGGDGTAGLRKRADGNGEGGVMVPVNRYTRRVRYKLPYAIPAIALLLLVAAVLVVGFTLVVLGQAGPNRMKVFLHKTSVGRVMTALLHQDEVTSGAPTKVWAERAGQTQIDFMGNIPRAAGIVQHEGAMGSEVYDPMLKGSPHIGLQEMKR